MILKTICFCVCLFHCVFLKVREKQDDINCSEAKGSESERKKNTAHQSFCLFVILLCWGQAPRAMQSKVWRSIEKGIHLCYTFQSRESLQRQRQYQNLLSLKMRQCWSEHSFYCQCLEWRLACSFRIYAWWHL